MLIDTQALMHSIAQSNHATGLVASLVERLTFAKDDKQLSVEEREQLGDLVCWLFVFGEDEHVLATGEVLLQITPGKDQEKWSPIELALSMPWILAQKRGDAALLARHAAKLEEAKAKRDPKVAFVFDMVRARQMNGEHLHDDEIAKAREAQCAWMEIRAHTRQLSRLCWILARGGSERMTVPILEEKIQACRDFLRAHTDVPFSEVYPA
jgi:hypothetical protein